MRRYDAVIFDMDRVLLDCEPLYFRALSELLASEGCAITDHENEEFIGATVEATWRCLVEDSPHGITEAKRAGMGVIAVRTPYTTRLALPDADLIVNSLAEVDLLKLGLPAS